VDVLLVDDDHNDMAFFGMAVDRTDLNIWLQTMASGHQAMDYLTGRDVYADRSMHPIPEVVVLDLKMPGMDGFEFLKWLRASPEFKALPVVVFSASEDQEELERALAMGANRKIAKPFQFEDWKKAVREIWRFAISTRRGPKPKVPKQPERFA
jgi:CheY-like chemotaxis protein